MLNGMKRKAKNFLSQLQELRGIAKLSEKHDFKGQTIKLGADIVLNEGDYNDWKQNYLKCVWKPIEDLQEPLMDKDIQSVVCIVWQMGIRSSKKMLFGILRVCLIRVLMMQ